MNWEKLPKELKILNFKDFCIRCDEIYDIFWVDFAPFFDISKYRDYLLEIVVFSTNVNKQKNMAGLAWEFLMGDLNKEDLYEHAAHEKLFR